MSASSEAPEEEQQQQKGLFDCGTLSCWDSSSWTEVVDDLAASMTTTTTTTTTSKPLPSSMSTMMASSSSGYRSNSQQQQQQEVSTTTVSGSTKLASNYRHSEHLRQLTEPPPTSMVLVAALQLLTAPLVPPHRVYLMTHTYLQNWLNWALHQPVASPNEQHRLVEVLRLAARRQSLACPTKDSQYTDPGPIDSNDLSMQGHPLLLRPDAAVLVQPAAPAPPPENKNGNNNGDAAAAAAAV